MPEHDFSEIAKLSERFSKDPKSRIFVQLADAYRKNGMIDEALEVLKQGLKFHPQYPLAHLIMGRCYFDKRLYAQAKESFETVIKFDPQNIVALRTLVQVTENLKDDAGQIAAYKGLLAVDPTDTGAREKLNVLEAALKKQSFYTVTMAEEYEHQGNLAEALKIYQQMSFNDPTDLGLQEKVSELKQKLSGSTTSEAPAKPKSEAKVEGLEQFESYIKPHEINLNEQQAPSVKDKAVISEISIDAKKPAAPPEKPATPVSMAPELVSSVTDFILNQTPPSKDKAVISEIAIDAKTPAAPPVEPLPKAPVVETETKIPESPPEVPAEPVPVSDILAAEPVAEPVMESQPELPAEPVPVSEILTNEPIPPTVEEEVMSLTDILSEIPPAVETTPTAEKPAAEIPMSAVEPINEPVASEPAPVTPPAADVEEVLPLADVLASSSETETKPVEPPAFEPEPVIPSTAEMPTPPTVTETAPETAPIPPAEEPKPAEDESTKKPKEEDFKSFQDWLSGLLK